MSIIDVFRTIIDAFHIGRFKRELATAKEELASLKLRLSDPLVLTYVQLRERAVALGEEVSALQTRISAAHLQLSDLDREIASKQTRVIQLDDEILLQEFGLYKPKYALTNSAAYKIKIDVLREQQSARVRGKTAATCAANWTLNGDQREGHRMVADYTKLIMRAFNNECDVTISGVKFSNVDTCQKRIIKSCEILNKLGSRMSIAITPSYLELKIKELELCYEYQVKKQEEKEELRMARARMREEAKLAREIEEAREALAKEEKHFHKAKSAMEEQIARASTDTERALCEKEIATINAQLEVIEKRRRDVDYREAHAKAGYVYVISNEGAFGAGVYKIGVTRRLEPMDRIDELGDSSVPFDFDVHALVFSDDAFGLEAALHGHFEGMRINRLNYRREFYRAPIDEIESTLIKNFGKPVEFIKLAEAAEYRQSLKLPAEAEAMSQNR